MIDETIFTGMEERNNDDESVDKPLFGDQFVRRGIERDYIIDLRTAAQKDDGATSEEADVADLESVFAAAVADTPISDAAISDAAVADRGASTESIESGEVIDQSEIQLARVKRSAMFGAPASDPAPVTAAIPANLFERPVDGSAVDSVDDAPIILTAGGRSLFDQSVASDGTLAQSVKDVQFVPAEQVRQLPWWIRPAALSFCALVLGIGAVQIVRSTGATDSDLETTDRPAVSAPVSVSTTLPEPVLTTAPVVVTTAAPTTAITLLVTTEAPATTAAPVTAVTRTTRRQPATTPVPTTATPTTEAPTTEAPTTVAPTTAPQITIVAPTTAPPTTAASTTAATTVPSSNEQLTTAP